MEKPSSFGDCSMQLPRKTAITGNGSSRAPPGSMAANISSTAIGISVRSAPDWISNRRRVTRFELTYRVLLSRPGEAFVVVTNTANVSCNGFYCISERPFLPHEKLECELAIPLGRPGDPLTNDLIMHAAVEVVRVMPIGIGKSFGLACRLEGYRTSVSQASGRTVSPVLQMPSRL